jgi:hypothetical protein
VSTTLHGVTPKKTKMFITKKVVTIIVPYILLARTYDAVQLILHVGCGGIIYRDHHGSIKKYYVHMKEKDKSIEAGGGLHFRCFHHIGYSNKTSHAYCLMRWAQHGKFVEKL